MSSRMLNTFVLVQDAEGAKDVSVEVTACTQVPTSLTRRSWWKRQPKDLTIRNFSIFQSKSDREAPPTRFVLAHTAEACDVEAK